MSNPLPKWFRARNYLHFDNRLSQTSENFRFVEDYVSDPGRVAAHSFYPFIAYTVRTPRYKKQSDGTRVMSFKERELCYAAHLDSQIYSFYSDKLIAAYEGKLSQRPVVSESVLAYRSLGKSNIEFASETFDLIVRSAPCRVYCFDVENFFGTLDHHQLKKAWCRVLDVDSLPVDHFKIWKSLTRYATVDRDEVFEVLGLSPADARTKNRLCNPSEFRQKIKDRGLLEVSPDPRGIPQGSPLSAVLSNIYLLDFDIAISQYLAEKFGGAYRRYSDDLLAICPLGEKEVSEKVESDLKALELTLNHQKSECFDFLVGEDSSVKVVGPKPLQYLGFIFDGQHRYVRSQTLSRFYRKMKRCIRGAVKRGKQKGGSWNSVPLRRLYQYYSHLGSDNFLAYAGRGQKAMGAQSMVRKQLGRHWHTLQKLLAKAREDF